MKIPLSCILVDNHSFCWVFWKFPSLLCCWQTWLAGSFFSRVVCVSYSSVPSTTKSLPLSALKRGFIFQFPVSLGNSEGKEDEICYLLFKCFIKKRHFKPSSVMSHWPSCCSSLTPCWLWCWWAVFDPVTHLWAQQINVPTIISNALRPLQQKKYLHLGFTDWTDGLFFSFSVFWCKCAHWMGFCDCDTWKTSSCEAL